MKQTYALSSGKISNNKVIARALARGNLTDEIASLPLAMIKRVFTDEIKSKV